MSFTVAQVLTTARDRHPAFDQRRNPDGVIFRYLNNYILKLAVEATNLDPASCTTHVDNDLTLITPATFDTFAILPTPTTCLQVLDAEVVYLNGQQGITRPVPCTIFPHYQRWDSGYFPSISQSDGQYLLRGTYADWTKYGILRIFYVPLPSTVTALSDTITIPGSPANHALPVLCDAVANFMAGRGVASANEPPVPRQDIMAAWKESEDKFFDIYRNRQQNIEPMRTRDLIM